jgi:hypothetical protein
VTGLLIGCNRRKSTKVPDQEMSGAVAEQGMSYTVLTSSRETFSKHCFVSVFNATSTSYGSRDLQGKQCSIRLTNPVGKMRNAPDI